MTLSDAEAEASDKPVDDRVEGSIEALNAAIDRVNLLEDTKQAMETTAERAARVVATEMDAIQREHAPVEKRLVPLMAAREEATAAMKAAQAAEERYAAALDHLEMAREGLKNLRHALPNADPGAAREMERHLRETQGAAAKRAAHEKREARRARSAANVALREVGKAGEKLERKAKLEKALQEDEEYRSLRKGLQAVLEQCDDRLQQIESEKVEAVSMVQDAMCHLETLSNELHETEGGAAGEACADDAGGAAEAKGGDAT